MTPEERQVRGAWMQDESGAIDLCLFCTEDAKHPLGATCTGFIWNGKRLRDIYSAKQAF